MIEFDMRQQNAAAQATSAVLEVFVRAVIIAKRALKRM
jgi:hypothetical protein